MKNKFLVTGGAGYIGSNLLYYFLKNDVDFVVVDNFSNTNNNNIVNLEKYFNKKITVYNCDILDEPKLNSIIQKEKINSVVHLAGKKYIPESFNVPDLYYKNNVIGTKNLLKIMSQNNVNEIFFASSIAVFGTPHKLPLDINSQTTPNSPYAENKLLCEKIIEKWQKENDNRKATIFRFTNPVGARENVLLGDYSNSKYLNLIPYLIKCIENEENISINGNSHKTKDGTTVRDYIHITDLCECVYKICMQNNYKCKYVIVGNGKTQYSVLDILTELFKIYNKPLKYSINPPRPNETPIIEIDNSYLIEHLNYSPKILLSEMLQSQINFNKKCLSNNILHKK